MYCFKCGVQLYEDSQFCSKCGRPVFKPERLNNPEQTRQSAPARQNIVHEQSGNPGYQRAVNPEIISSACGKATNSVTLNSKGSIPLVVKVIAVTLSAVIIIGGGTALWKQLSGNSNKNKPEVVSPSPGGGTVEPVQDPGDPTNPKPGDSTNKKKEEEDTRSAYERMFLNGPLPVLSEEGLWGFVDEAGNYVIYPLFNDAYRFSEEGLALVQDEVSRLYGYIDNSGEYVIAPKFTEANSFSDGLAVAKQDGEYFGYIDTSGSFSIEPQFHRAYNFTDGLAPVLGDLDYPQTPRGFAVSLSVGFGYIDRSGEYVISPNFINAWSFTDGIAFVTFFSDGDGASGLKRPIDKTGRGLSSVPYELNTYYGTSNGTLNSAVWGAGLCRVKIGGRYAFIDRTGEIVLPADGSYYAGAGDFSSDRGLAAAMNSSTNLWGYIDLKGNWVIPAQFVYAGQFSRGTAVVGFDSGQRLEQPYQEPHILFSPQIIDETGNIISSFPGADMYVSSSFGIQASSMPDYPGVQVRYAIIPASGLYAAYQGSMGARKYGYIDVNNNVIIDFIFDNADWFAPDRSFAKVEYEGLYGFINDKGEWLIPAMFKEIR